jgi:preprotein translocase subunit Sss1
MSMLSAMEYPADWIMVAGAVLLVVGFIGFCISQMK